MREFLQFCIIGLAAGSLYSLLAIGLVVIYRGSGVVNFAQGATGLVGAFLFYELNHQEGWPFWPSFIAGVGIAMAVGFLTYVCVMRPLRRATTLVRIVGSLAVLLIIEGIANIHYGYQTLFVPSALPTYAWTIAGVRVASGQVIILLICSALVCVLWSIYKFSLFGLRTSAVTENSMAATYVGISPDLIAALNWAIGGAIAGIAAILIIPISGLSISGLSLLVIPAAAAALVGNMASFPLTFCGGLGIGMAQSLIGRYLNTTNYPLTHVAMSGLIDAVPFILIIVVLVIRGTGIPDRSTVKAKLSAVGSGTPRPLAILILAAAVLVPVCLFASPTWIGAFTITAITGIILLSFVVVTGYAGQLSLAQFALAGVGGLIAAWCSGGLGLPFLLALLLAALAAIPIGIVVGLPALKTRGVTLAIVTLGFAVALDSMLFENLSIAAGFNGGVKIDAPAIFGFDINSITHPQRYLTFVVVGFVLCAMMVVNLRRSSVGRRLLAVRANERASSALGVSVPGVKLYGFAFGSSIAAVGGTLLVFQLPPIALFGSFDPVSSIQLVSESVVGGVGYVIGPLIGATMQPGSVGAQVIQSATGGSSGVNNWLYLISGVLLLAVLLQAPDGLARLNTDLVLNVAHRLRRTARARSSAGQPLPFAPALAVTQRRLAVRNLTVRFGGVTALNDVSISVGPGEIVGLIGPNGAGKTTMIDAISGFVKPASGSIELDGSDIRGWSSARRAKEGIGRSFQGLELFEEMTVYENLQVGAEPVAPVAYFTNLFWPTKVSPSAAMSASCHEFRLAEVLSRPPSELPYGQRRLVAIARAVAAQPSIVLLDEPASGLDEHERQELRTLIRRLATEWGMGVLIIEHDVALMMNLCDHICVLNFGQEICNGPPAEVRKSQAVIDAYLGTDDDEDHVPTSAQSFESLSPQGSGSKDASLDHAMSALVSDRPKPQGPESNFG